MSAAESPDQQQDGVSAPSSDEDNNKEDGRGVAPKSLQEDFLKNKNSVLQYHASATSQPPKIDAFLDPSNAGKNRFPSALLYDKTRVRIKDKYGSDYYHASFVDSYDKENFSDFWRMCFCHKPSVIVLLGALSDRDNRQKKFWPGVKRERQYVKGGVRVRCISVLEERDNHFFEIAILGAGQHNKSAIKMLLIHSFKWNDDRDIPDNLMDLRAVIKIKISMARHESANEGPQLLVCHSGIHRSGTFAALNILVDRVTTEKKVGLDETLSVLRSQRYGCVSFYEHYKLLHELVVHLAVSLGLVDPAAIAVKR